MIQSHDLPALYKAGGELMAQVARVGTLQEFDAGLCEDGRTVLLYARVGGEWFTASFELQNASGLSISSYDIEFELFEPGETLQ